jgi:hypothetical protein
VAIEEDRKGVKILPVLKSYNLHEFSRNFEAKQSGEAL